MFKELFVLFVVCFVFGNAGKTQCRHDSECGSGECCYYHEGPMVVSKKRQLEKIAFPQMVQGGWCEKYRLQGEHCSSFAKMNGHCGCAPGLKCTFIKDPTIAPLILQPVHTKRSIIGGGHQECRP